MDDQYSYYEETVNRNIVKCVNMLKRKFNCLCFC